VVMTEAAISAAREAMPELPAAKIARFTADYGLSAYDAGVLTATRSLAAYFEAAVKAGAPAKAAASWISVELLRRLNDAGKDIDACPVAPDALAALLKVIEKGDITAASGKKVFAKMFDTGRSAADIIAADGLAQITDTAPIEKAAREIIAKNPDNVAKYRAGNEGVFKFFVGQVMRETRGQANPQAVNDILKKILAE
jgi:aspartyl-tRNA(Asn)/glutamyl-tRNA(Gln) amidotransferase subunit B